MADCVHIRCQPYISCLRTGSAWTFKDVANCDYCKMGVVFVPADLLWVLAAGRYLDKATCEPSPDRKHGVRR